MLLSGDQVGELETGWFSCNHALPLGYASEGSDARGQLRASDPAMVDAG